MKTKTLLLFQLLLFFYFNSFSQSWTDPICDGNDIISAPYYERSCTYSSDAFNNNWKMLSGDYYVPDNHTPTKTILVNFNVFLDNNWQNNYPNNQSTIEKFDSIVNHINLNFYDDIAALLANPIDPNYNPPYLPDTKIRFEIAGVYFYNNTTLNTTTYLSSVIGYISSNYPSRLNAINICFTEGIDNSASGRANTPNFDFGYNLGVITYEKWSKGGSAWVIAQHLAHELGHNLDLLHPYAGGSETCIITNDEYLEDLLNNFVTPNCTPSTGCDVCYHQGGFSCVPSDPNTTCTNNLMGGGNHGSYYVTPLQMGKMHRSLSIKTTHRYVKNNVFSNVPWYISENQVWDFKMRFYNDIVINNNSTLTLQCSLYMPEFGNITVNPGCRLIIDEGALLTGYNNNWQGTIHVKENAELIVKDGSSINMGGNGHILIDYANGAAGKLRFFNGANIILNDNDTKLEIKGDLQLMAGAQFGTAGNGYVLFNSPLADNLCYNIIAGSNTSMDFSGSSSSHKKLEIAQPSLYMHNIKYISFANCKVVMSGSNSRLSLYRANSGSINLNNVTITSNTGNRTGNRGIALYGQTNITIQNSVFSNGLYGIHAMLNYTDGAPLTLTNCTFYNNDRGLNVNDKGITLNYCTFDGNGYGVYADGMTFSSSINTSVLNNNTDGVNYISSSTGGLYIYNPEIKYNYNGVNFSGATKLTVRCGQIKNNTYGINFLSNASLNMSQNESPTGGKVNMSSNSELNISTNYGNLLFLNSGYNNLQRSPNKQVINGILTGYNYCPKNLAVQSNRWNASNTSPVSGTDYTLNDDNSFCRPGGSVIFLIDNTPTYGICSIPTGFSLGQDNTFSSSSLINTPNYNFVSLSFALSDAVSLIESGNYYVAADRLYEILNYPLLATSEADKYYLNKAYLYMKQNMASVIQALISDTAVTAQNTLANYAGKLRSIQNKIINQTQNNANDYNTYFYTSLDKALLYRALYQYDDALLNLNNILLVAKPAYTDEVNKWLCLTQLEKDVLDSIVRKEEFFELKQLCESNMSLKIAPNNTNESSQNDSLQNENEILNINISERERAYIKVTPNPVTNQSVIETFIPDFEKQAEIKVLDMLGRTASTLNVTNASSRITLSNSSLKEGVYYFILIKDDVILDKIRVVFVKD